MSAFWTYLSLVILLSPSGFCANILAIVPTPSYSHQVAFTTLWKELSLRGHKVTVLTTDPQSDPELTNLTEIDMQWSYKYFNNVSKMVEGSMNMWNTFDAFIDITTRISEEQLSYGPIQDLMKGKHHFDLLLLEGLFAEFLGFAEIYHCPKILISSLDALTFIHGFFGNPVHPLLNPEYFTPFYGDLAFKERVVGVIFYLYFSIHTTGHFLRQKQNILSKYFNTKSTIEELISDVDMLFLNVNPVLQKVRALGPSTITIGDFRRNTSITPLSEVSTTPFCREQFFIFFDIGGKCNHIFS